MASVFLRPDADDTDGTWTNELGATSLYESIDETSASDADYIRSASDPVSDLCKIRLSNPGTTVAEPAIVRVRYKKDGTGSDIDLTVRLLQGASEIAAWTYPDIDTTYVTAEETLTTPEFELISDFDDLFLEFTANVSSTAGSPIGLLLALTKA
jgi:hypothetical protein